MSNEKQIQYIDPKKITVRDGFNLRKDFGDMKALKASILETGIIDPVQVLFEPTTGEIILGAQGHRRHAALTELRQEGHKKAANGSELLFPVVPEAEGLTDEERTLFILTLNTGKPLELLEQAAVYEKLVPSELGKDARNARIKELAARTGVSATHVTNLLTLLTAPKSLIKLIESGKVSATMVIDLFLEKRNWERVEELVIQAIADAESKGKKKATKKNVKDEEGEEDDDEDKEEEKQANADRKARLKELQGFEKRTLKLIESLSEFKAAAGEDAVDKLAIEAVLTALVFVSGKPNEGDGFEPSLADVKVAIRSVFRKASEETKAAVAAVKEEAKTKLGEVKEAAAAKVEAVKEAASEKVEAVKEKLDEVKAKVATKKAAPAKK